MIMNIVYCLQIRQRIRKNRWKTISCHWTYIHCQSHSGVELGSAQHHEANQAIWHIDCLVFRRASIYLSFGGVPMPEKSWIIAGMIKPCLLALPRYQQQWLWLCMIIDFTLPIRCVCMQVWMDGWISTNCAAPVSSSRNIFLCSFSVTCNQVRLVAQGGSKSNTRLDATRGCHTDDNGIMVT